MMFPTANPATPAFVPRPSAERLGKRAQTGSSRPPGGSGHGLLHMFRSLTITTQLLIAMVGLVLVASASVGFSVYWTVERAILPLVAQRLEGDARRLANQLISKTGTYQADLQAQAISQPLAKFVETMRSGTPDRAYGWTMAEWKDAIEQQFITELAVKPDYLQLRVIGADGRELIRVDKGEAGLPPFAVPAAGLQDKSHRPYIPATLSAESGSIYVSAIDLNREFGAVEEPFLPTVRFATPIDAADGSRFGLVILNVDMRESFDALRRAVPPASDLYIINGQGDYLVHPDRSLEFGFDRGERILFSQDQPNLAAAIGEESSGSTTMETDETPFLALAWVEAEVSQNQPPLSIIMTRPLQLSVVAPQVRETAGLVALIAAALASIAVALAARAIVRPIVAMTAGVADASAGRPVNLPTDRGGEIGVLARALTDYIERERFDTAIVNSSNDAILTTDRDGIIVRWNPAATLLFEVEGANAAGRKVEDVIAPPGAVEVENWFKSATGPGGTLGAVEISRERRDGSLSDIALRPSPVRAPDGSILGLSIIARDVTASREAQEMFRLSVEYSPAGNVLVDDSGTIILVNAQTEAVFGYPRDELIGQPVDKLLPPAALGQHATFMADYLKSPSRRAMGNERDVFGRRKTGEIVPIEVGLTPVPTRNGMLVLAAIVDQSAARKAQRDLKARSDELERSNKDLMQFAYVASHDLQEPLRMVASFTQLLADRYQGQLDERADKYIHFAVDGAKRMQSLINDLLDYSRVGATARELEPVDIADIWTRVVRVSAKTIQSAEAVIETGDLPDRVLGDSEHLSRLLQNLLSNALKFRSEAPPHVTFGAERTGETWTFTMTDNGIGFEARDGTRVFEMFQRLNDRGRYEGTGLGLAIAKRIVDQHGGRIWVDSKPGHGSAFHFTLSPVDETSA